MSQNLLFNNFWSFDTLCKTIEKLQKDRDCLMSSIQTLILEEITKRYPDNNSTLIIEHQNDIHAIEARLYDKYCSKINENLSKLFRLKNEIEKNT